uniref:Secreted peptide n=1 Tax=Pyxicephalus adspersus TaxID=30357 RepID=A0AAV3ASX7_PYXAD|nr:TPA: hypothetical protein GDO54_011365 [Pyxicephalus adspersus]
MVLLVLFSLLLLSAHLKEPHNPSFQTCLPIFSLLIPPLLPTTTYLLSYCALIPHLLACKLFGAGSSPPPVSLSVLVCHLQPLCNV